MKHVICPIVESFFQDAPEQRHNAVLFRGCVYVAAPRHQDAVNLAFAGMTEMQRHRVCNRIADAKETMLFGTALGDGSSWEWNENQQEVRMKMYGFD